MLKYLGLLLIIGALPANGAYQNYNSTVLGASSAGLGGAATAVVGDSSANHFYNPALMMFELDDNITATVNIYNKYNTDYGKTTNFLEAGRKVNQGFFRSIPSASGNVLKWDRFALGLSIIVPDFDQYTGKVASKTNVNSFLSYTDESLWAGGALAYKIDDYSSLGATLYYASRRLNRSVSDQLTLTPTQMVFTNEEKNLTHNALVLNLGYYNKIRDWFSFGANLRLPAITISGTGSYFKSTTDTAALPGSILRLEDVKARTYIPVKSAIGMAFRPSDRWLISLDIQHYFSHSYNDLDNTEAADHYNHRPTTNGALGIEYVFRDPEIKVRAGIFSNLSSHEKIIDDTLTKRLPDHIDMLGFSSNVSFKTHDNVEYTLGGVYNSGQGSAVERIGNALKKIGKDQKIFSALLSVTIRFH